VGLEIAFLVKTLVVSYHHLSSLEVN
jgi:hypothetical protein